MKNADIIKNLPQLKALEHEHKMLKAQIRGLEKQRQQLEGEIYTLREVTEVFEGVALCINETSYEHGLNLNAYAVDNMQRRYAEVYPNAHTKGKDWGLVLREHGQLTGRGTNWAYADAVLVAKCWTAHGAKPTLDFETMCKVRHKLDPAGRVTKRRRLAFEAAWTAGHHELACELLVSRTRIKQVAAQIADDLRAS